MKMLTITSPPFNSSQYSHERICLLQYQPWDTDIENFEVNNLIIMQFEIDGRPFASDINHDTMPSGYKSGMKMAWTRSPTLGLFKPGYKKCATTPPPDFPVPKQRHPRDSKRSIFALSQDKNCCAVLLSEAVAGIYWFVWVRIGQVWEHHWFEIVSLFMFLCWIPFLILIDFLIVPMYFTLTNLMLF